MPSLRPADITGNADLVQGVKTNPNAYTGAVTGALGTAQRHISAQKIRAEALLAEVAQLREKARAEAERANAAAATGEAGAAATAAQIGRLETALTAVLTELGRVVLPDNINISRNAPLATAIEVGITAALAANDVAAAAIDAATAAITRIGAGVDEETIKLRTVAAGVAAYKGMMAKHRAMNDAAGGAGGAGLAVPTQEQKNNAIATAMVRGYINRVNPNDRVADAGVGSADAVRALVPQVVATVRDAEVTADPLNNILTAGFDGLQAAQAGGAKKRRSTKRKSTSTKKKSSLTKRKSTSTKKKSTVTKRKSTKKRSTKGRK
jgi:hypothetical protein